MLILDMFFNPIHNFDFGFVLRLVLIVCTKKARGNQLLRHDNVCTNCSQNATASSIL